MDIHEPHDTSYTACMILYPLQLVSCGCDPTAWLSHGNTLGVQWSRTRGCSTRRTLNESRSAPRVILADAFYGRKMEICQILDFGARN